jgi:hypothetical protein
VSDPLIVQCAVTGSADPDPQRRPNLPVTGEQIIEEALAAWRAGAMVLHLHAREADGTPAQDRAAFDCGTIDVGERIFEGDLPFLRRMAEAFQQHGVRPELESSTPDMSGHRPARCSGWSTATHDTPHIQIITRASAKDARRAASAHSCWPPAASRRRPASDMRSDLRFPTPGA